MAVRLHDESMPCATYSSGGGDGSGALLFRWINRHWDTGPMNSDGFV